MFIGLCGAICVGKSTIADFLVKEEGFTRLHLNADSSPHEPQQLSLAKLKLNKEIKNASDEKGKINQDHVFTDAEALLNFVTANWRENWVTTDIYTDEIAETFIKRPFFLLVSVDAPVTSKFERYIQRCLSLSLPQPSLAQFIEDSDRLWYSSDGGLAVIHQKAALHFVNNAHNLESLYLILKSVNLSNESRLRPNWDQYFMQLAHLASLRSNCMKRRVGCVLVREKRVISTGYNGTPRGMQNCSEGGCPRCNSSARGGTALDTCMCIHAEENALLEAGRERIREGSTLYCDTCPCLTCSVKIAQVGISEVVYSKDYAVDSVSAKILEEAGVKIRQFSPPRAGLVNVEAIWKSLTTTT